ncbi:unnamed protein product [Brassica oleracea var. botrytis]
MTYKLMCQLLLFLLIAYCIYLSLISIWCIVGEIETHGVTLVLLLIVSSRLLSDPLLVLRYG